MTDNCVPDCADGTETKGQVNLALHTVVNSEFTVLDETSALLPQDESFTLPSTFITTG